jgi:hypothetical protein
VSLELVYFRNLAATVITAAIRQERVGGDLRRVAVHSPSTAADTARRQPHHLPHNRGTGRARCASRGGRSGRQRVVRGHDTMGIVGRHRQASARRHTCNTGTARAAALAAGRYGCSLCRGGPVRRRRSRPSDPAAEDLGRPEASRHPLPLRRRRHCTAPAAPPSTQPRYRTCALRWPRRPIGPAARGRWPRHRVCRRRHRQVSARHRACSTRTARAGVYAAGRHRPCYVEEGQRVAGVAGRRIQRQRVEGIQRPVHTHCPSAAANAIRCQPHHPLHSGNASSSRCAGAGDRSGRCCAVGGRDTAGVVGDTGRCRRAAAHATRAQRVQRCSPRVDMVLAVLRRAGATPA